jgi:hypothetical protein
MSSSAHPLLDRVRYSQLPTPLAEAAHTLSTETEVSGEHTTADEVVGVIEALFALLGRQWVAEYLAAGAPDAAANRMLYDRLVATGGRVLGGAWLGVGRSLRAVFLAHGLRPVAEGLLDIEFGELHQPEHPFARLSAYRNSFAHGSFQSVVDDIRSHRELLAGQLERMPFLWHQPWLVDTGEGVVALRQRGELAPRPPVALPPGQPCMVGPDGRVVSLYPLALARGDADGWRLDWPGKKEAGPQDIVKFTRFQLWFERFQLELAGDVEVAATCLGAPVAWPEAVSALADCLQQRARGLVLVETAPGAPRRGVLAGAAATDAGTLMWRVVPDDLMASGLVLTRAILRATERLLGLARHTLPCRDADEWREALRRAGAQLDEAGRILRVVLDDLHRGDVPARTGEPSVQEVWRALAGGPFLAVGGCVRHWSLRPLPWDARVSLRWGPDSDVVAVADFLRLRAQTSLHRRVLGSLLGRKAGDLFELCDALDSDGQGAGGPVFEPAVERALWDLAPLIEVARVDRDEDGGRQSVRTFACPGAELVRAALEVVG